MQSYGYGVSSPQVPYQWVWADATARVAQSVTSSQVGFRGFQTDIGLEYVLLSSSPVKWGTEYPNDTFRQLWPNYPNVSGTALLNPFGGGLFNGTGTTPAMTGTTVSEQIPRATSLSAAGAGSLANFRYSGALTPLCEMGYRYNMIFTIEKQSGVNERRFNGIGPALTVNINPNNIINCIGVGREEGDTNLSMFWNDGAGVATKTPLGANFPANANLLGYTLDLWGRIGAASIAWQVTSLNNRLKSISGVASSNIMAAGTKPVWNIFSCNNTDAITTQVGCAIIMFWPLYGN